MTQINRSVVNNLSLNALAIMSKAKQPSVVDDLLYIANPLRRSDWLLEVKFGELIRHLPCHSAMLCNASKVLNELDEGTKPDNHGKTVIPFPGSEKEARSCLKPVLFIFLMLTTRGLTQLSSSMQPPYQFSLFPLRRALLNWLYQQQMPLAMESIVGLVTISHQWDIAGLKYLKNTPDLFVLHNPGKT